MQCSQPHNAKVPKDLFSGKTPGASRWHLVSPSQEVANPMIDKLINRPIGHQSGPIAEVVSPAVEYPIQPDGYLRPRALIATTKHFANAPLQTLDTALRWFGGQVPMTVFAVPLRSKGVAQKIKMLPTGISDTGLGLVESKTHVAHRPSGPLQSFQGSSPTQDHEVIRIVDQPSLIPTPFAPLTPDPKKPVDIDIGEQRANDSMNAKDNFEFTRVIIYQRSWNNT